MAQLFSNNAISLLQSSIAYSDTEIHLTPGRGNLFPQPIYSHDYFLVTLENSENPEQYEIIKISGRTNDTLFIAPNGRGYENTIQQNWPVATSICDHRITAGSLNRFLPAKQSRISTIPDDNQKHIIDEFTASKYTPTCKWIVTLTTDEVNFKTRSFEILASFKNGAIESNWTRYAVVGDNILHTIDVIQTGFKMQLRIENKQNINLIINITRINQL